MCKRETPIKLAENHHLIPRGIAKRNKYVDLPQLEKGKEAVSVSCTCGDQLHQLFTDKELAENYNTLEKLLANEKVQNWIKWIQKKQDDFNICMKTKKER